MMTCWCGKQSLDRHPVQPSADAGSPFPQPSLSSTTHLLSHTCLLYLTSPPMTSKATTENRRNDGNGCELWSASWLLLRSSVSVWAKCATESCRRAGVAGGDQSSQLPPIGLCNLTYQQTGSLHKGALLIIWLDWVLNGIAVCLKIYSYVQQ